MSWFFVGAAVVTAAGQIQSGRQANAAAQSEANMAEYNAKMADIQANQAYAAAGVQEEDLRKRARAAVGLQLAASAEAGAGLDANLLNESLMNVEEDSMAIRYEGNLKAQGLNDTALLQRSSAVVSRDRGRQAVSASYLSASSSLLSGAGQGYGNQARIAAAKK